MKISKSFRQCILLTLIGITLFLVTYASSLSEYAAYEDGYKFALANGSFEDNPYRGCRQKDHLYAAWSDGWIKANYDIRNIPFIEIRSK